MLLQQQTVDSIQRLLQQQTVDGPQPNPNDVRSVISSSHCNSLNDLRQITQNLVCRGLVSSGNQDVASTTKGWQHPSCRLNQRDPPQESEKLMDLKKSWHIKFPKNRYQFNGDSTVSIRPTKIREPQYKRLQPTPDGNKPTEKETKKPSHGRTTNTHKCRVIAHWHRLRTS